MIYDYLRSKERECSTAFMLDGPQEYTVFCITSGIGMRISSRLSVVILYDPCLTVKFAFSNYGNVRGKISSPREQTIRSENRNNIVLIIII